MSSNNGVSKNLRRRLIEAAGFRCQECGLPGFVVPCESRSFCVHTNIPNVYLSVDHIIPRSKGGSSDERNLRVVCTRCNSKK